MEQLKGKLTTAKEYLLTDESKRAFLIVAVLFVFDAVAAVIITSYTDRSGAVTLSDLLFLEGALAFAIGSFVALAGAGKGAKKTKEPIEPATETQEQLSSKKISLGPLMMIMGVFLILLSMVIGALLA